MLISKSVLLRQEHPPAAWRAYRLAVYWRAYRLAVYSEGLGKQAAPSRALTGEVGKAL